MPFELRPYQQEAVDAVYEHLRTKDTNPCVVLPTGCHAKGHPILMYDGSVKNVEDIVVGDLLMGPDSKPRRVLQLARGHEPMAKVIPNRGEAFVVNRNHILSLVGCYTGKAKYRKEDDDGRIYNISITDYLQKSKNWKHGKSLYKTAVNFPVSQALDLDPYILGLLLGDGSLINTVSYTTADAELATEFINYAENNGCDIRVRSNGSKAMTYHAVGKIKNHNPLLCMIQNNGLYQHNSYSKFIPRKYLLASREERLELLAGLLDTDGYCRNGYVDFITASEQLGKDICFLGRSLGFLASCRRKKCTCQNGFTGEYTRVFFSGDLSQIPFRRFKHCPAQKIGGKDVLRTGFKIELLPDDDYYGFTVDGDHLYVDGNFFVMHNCGKSLVLAKIVAPYNWTMG